MHFRVDFFVTKSNLIIIIIVTVMARVIITWDDEVPSLQYSDTVGSQQ